MQRQVLQPAPAYVADQSTTATGATGSHSKVTQESAYDDSLQGRQSFSAGSHSTSRTKAQVFLPGEKAYNTAFITCTCTKGICLDVYCKYNVTTDSTCRPLLSQILKGNEILFKISGLLSNNNS